MFFSIIIPLYNRPEEINELLETLTLQTYTGFEVLIIEDGSQRSAKTIVESYQSKLEIYYHYKENQGQGFARNYGFARAKGDYFIVFDSDCLIPPHYLEVVYKYLSNNPLDAFGGPDAAHHSFTSLQKAISYSMTSPFTTGGTRGNKKHLGRFHPRSFNMGLSRKVWEVTKGFIITRLGEDIEYSIRILKNGFKVGLIPNAVVYHKRRTNLIQFYKQLHFFGRARVNVFKFFPNELKLVHFFPALFLVFLLTLVLANWLCKPLAIACNSLLMAYILLIFFHSWGVNKSAKIAFLSILTSFVQLVAYGFGFIQDYWRRIIIKQSD